jgi:hypothetical protein
MTRSCEVSWIRSTVRCNVGAISVSNAPLTAINVSIPWRVGVDVTSNPLQLTGGGGGVREFTRGSGCCAQRFDSSHRSCPLASLAAHRSRLTVSARTAFPGKRPEASDRLEPSIPSLPGRQFVVAAVIFIAC